jgi:hypothetical protein
MKSHSTIKMLTIVAFIRKGQQQGFDPSRVAPTIQSKQKDIRPPRRTIQYNDYIFLPKIGRESFPA